MYLRLSDGRRENGTFVEREAVLRADAQRRGWVVYRVVIENDMTEDGRVKNASAWKRRKIGVDVFGNPIMRVWRPGFRDVLNDLASGAAQALLVEDSDRALRDHRDLEDLLDIVEVRGAYVGSRSGSLQLTAGGTPEERDRARDRVRHSARSSEDTSRRVKDGRERQVGRGVWGGGRRPFGFTPVPHPNGMYQNTELIVNEAEAAIILDCSVRIVQAAEADDESEKSVTLRSLAAELRRKKVPTVTGVPWTAETLRDILLRQANAGLLVYLGEEVGDAPWEPIVPLPTFRAVQRILRDPNRRTGPGAAPKYLGTTLFKCGKCTDADFTNPVGVQVTLGGREPRYVCKRQAHLTRNMAEVNKLVVATILARLSRADAVQLLTPARPEIDTEALRKEAAAIRLNLNEMAADQILGKVTKEQLHAASAVGNARIEQIASILNTAVVDSPIKNLIGAEDIEAAWESLTLAHQRLIVDTLVTVRIMPVGRRGRGFDPDSVEIRFKEQLASERPPVRPRSRRTAASNHMAAA
ncbi:recombinase family protein [Hamadaea sp. NPDC050747]|uniref:recombinase family protein n=1 Tax=Hamadaea sp. NPDC050747 TaxID=3155789 RepID=UPI003402D9A5